MISGFLTVSSAGFQSAKASTLAYAPVSGEITSQFGWRQDPLGAGSRFHSGLDIAAPEGTPIYAPQNAYVAFSGPYKGYGNVVVLDHGYGFYTLYGHASALYVKQGQPILRGQAIAAVGTTGRSTGPHVHFEVHQNGQYVDPVVYLTYLSQQGQQLAAAQRPIPYRPIASAPIQISVSNGGKASTNNSHNTSYGEGGDLIASASEPPRQMPRPIDPSQMLAAQMQPDSLQPELDPGLPNSQTKSLGKVSQGISVPVQSASGQKVAQTKSSQAKASAQTSTHHQSTTSSKIAKRAGRFLISSAVQVVSGGRISWVRF